MGYTETTERLAILTYFLGLIHCNTSTPVAMTYHYLTIQKNFTNNAREDDFFKNQRVGKNVLDFFKLLRKVIVYVKNVSGTLWNSYVLRTIIENLNKTLLNLQIKIHVLSKHKFQCILTQCFIGSI